LRRSVFKGRSERAKHASECQVPRISERVKRGQQGTVLKRRACGNWSRRFGAAAGEHSQIQTNLPDWSAEYMYRNIDLYRN
jgi:hypothetical protein